MISLPVNVFDVFNDITYFDEPHKYYDDEGIPYISTTTLIHEYLPEFDGELHSENYAIKHNLTQNQVKYAWEFLNYYGTRKGSAAHDYAENLLINKVFNPYDVNQIIGDYGYDIISGGFKRSKKIIDKFYSDIKGKLIPVRTELVVFDRDFGIAGMLDLLVFNVKTGKLEIWDYKTNKNITTRNDFGRTLSGCLSHIDDCDLEIYSLQLSIYKKIIEKNTGLELGDSYLVWVNESNDSYKVIKTNNRQLEVKLMINDIKKAT